MPTKKTARKTAAKKAVKRKPPNAGKGRPKGSKNKVTVALKDGIMEAYQKAGGVRYLVGVAKSDPKTFCGLLGRILPHEVQADLKQSGDVTFTMVYQNSNENENKS